VGTWCHPRTFQRQHLPPGEQRLVICQCARAGKATILAMGRSLLERYPSTVLRIRFADGLNLQVTLPSRMILTDVKKVMASYLDESMAVQDFFLFTCPLRSVLASELSLVQLGLAPASVVYVGRGSGRDTARGFLTTGQDVPANRPSNGRTPSSVVLKRSACSIATRQSKRFRQTPSIPSRRNPTD